MRRPSTLNDPAHRMEDLVTVFPRRAARLACALALVSATLAAAAPARTTAATPAVPKHATPAHAATQRGATAAVAPAPGDTLRIDPRIRTGTLPNGLRYFIRANHKPEHRVSLRLAVDVGSTAEADDQQGLAHLIEHMNFNGSAHFRPDQLVAYLQSIGMRFGADANAGTSFDQTVYSLDVPTDRDTSLDRGLDAMSDFAGRATLADVEIDKERRVVLEEWRLGRGADERIERKQLPVVFHGSRYADRLPIGLPEIIEHAPYDRLRAFYRDWYTPDHMALVAVGDIDPARMERLVREHFADLKRPATPRPTPHWDVPLHAEPLVSVATDPEATRSSVSVYWKRPRRVATTAGEYRDDIVTGLYESMLNSRLSELAQRADAPFLFAGGGLQGLSHGTEAWSLFAAVKDGGIERGLAATLDEMARVRAHGFLPAELQRAKDDLRASWERLYAERDLTESPRIASEYVRHFLDGEPAPGVETEYAIVRSVLGGITLDEVNARTAGFVHDGGLVVLATAPDKAPNRPTETALRDLVARAATAAPAAWVDSLSGKTLVAKPPTPGRVVKTRTLDALGVTVLTLSNGVEVWLKPTEFKADEIVFGATAHGGSSLQDSAAYAVASFGGSVLGSLGLGGYTSTDLDKLLAGRIAGVAPSYGPYTQGVNGSARPADLETALQLTYLLFTDVTRDPAAFAAAKQRMLQALADRRNSPEAVFGDSTVAVNSGGFYMYRVPTAPAIEAVTLDDVLAYHRAHFANAADFTFAFAGNFKVDSIAPLLAKWLGALPSRGAPASEFRPVGPRYPARVVAKQVHKGMEPKASTRITFFTNGAPVEELDMHRARAAATILNDHLRQVLREKMGGTYSAGGGFSNLAPLPGYATTSISFGSDPARVDSLVAAAFGEVRSLREQGPSTTDLEKEQEIERRELEVAMKQNGWWTGAVLTAKSLGIDPERIAHRRERIDLLTIDNVREAFRKYWPLDRYTVMTLLPEAGAAAPEQPK